MEFEKKKPSSSIMNYQGFCGVIQKVETPTTFPSIQRVEYDFSYNVGTWRTVYPVYSNVVSKRKPIDSDLQKLSQKVMKRIWDNKEDEFWDTY